MKAFLWLLLYLCVLDGHNTGAGSSSPSRPYLAACELHQCFPPLRRADPQLFFGIALILIALSALTFRQMRGPYGFD